MVFASGKGMMGTTRSTGKSAAAKGSVKASRQAAQRSRKQPKPKSTALVDECGRWVPARSGAGVWLRDHLEVGKATTFAVGMGIVLRIDDSLVCWAKVETLAKDINSSDSSVERGTKILRGENLMRSLFLYRGRTRVTNLYVLNVMGWLDDAPDLIARIEHVRAQALQRGQVQPLPEGTRLVLNED